MSCSCQRRQSVDFNKLDLRTGSPLSWLDPLVGDQENGSNSALLGDNRVPYPPLSQRPPPLLAALLQGRTLQQVVWKLHQQLYNEGTVKPCASSASTGCDKTSLLGPNVEREWRRQRDETWLALINCYLVFKQFCLSQTFIWKWAQLP